MLYCYSHGALVHECFGCLVFHVVSSVSPLCKDLSASNIKSSLVCFVDEDYFGKWSSHGFVKRVLLRHHCNVPMMYKALYWEEQAALSTVSSSHKAGYSILVFFLVVVQQAEKIFTKRSHVTLRQAVFLNFTKVLRVCVSGLYTQNALGDSFPTWRSSMGLSTKLWFFTCQQTPSFTSIRS